ncbi:MAG: class I SAM-dependent methyltransferase, partial [Myxococcota bacterium]
MNRDQHEANRRSWNHATRVHNLHKRDQAAFLRGGGSTLFPEERALLGAIAGLRLVHLQCNSGQDTLSLAALGAVVTGIDISDEAITFAESLSRDSGLPGAFVRADVYDWLAEAPPASADVVFTSYGALPWLTDLPAWAAGIARVLAPGGRLVVVEFHPVGFMFDGQFRVAYPYSAPDEPLLFPEGIGDYVGLAGGALSPSGHVALPEPFVNPEPVYERAHGIGDVLGAVLGAGLRLDRFEEWPYANGCPIVDTLVEGPGRRFAPPPGIPSLPLMYGLVARR